jgi:hypothetical protein
MMLNITVEQFCIKIIHHIDFSNQDGARYAVGKVDVTCASTQSDMFSKQIARDEHLASFGGGYFLILFLKFHIVMISRCVVSKLYEIHVTPI